MSVGSRERFPITGRSILLLNGAAAVVCLFWLTLAGTEAEDTLDAGAEESSATPATTQPALPTVRPPQRAGEQHGKWPLFWVMTAPQHEDTRCREILSTWARQVPAHSLVFMGSARNRTAATHQRFFSLPVDPEKKALKEFLSWRLVLQEFPDRDWYVKTDDDTYLIVGNLNRYVESLDASLPYFLGCKFHQSGPGGFQYVSGGAGYVLSSVAAKRLAGATSNCIGLYGSVTEGDIAIAHCLQTVGVFAEDTRDDKGRQRFHALPYDQHANWYLYGFHINKFWMHDYLWGPDAEGLMSCCGENTTISFHYMSGFMESFVWPPKLSPAA
eukprot:TRINITY_DN45198_c0_g1_i1.p1 TRINITY_DN45198_c0_g1~~TRINITY_DN45198_c0_g1_i1.p1  ORF type:complete len:328 (-),score=43.69 TRINITY_DN45198_c0_g1_i1:25-1008(-)